MRRLVCVDASRESAACLACVYLNEYRTAVAAFTLHAAELKIVRVSQLVVFVLVYINSVSERWPSFAILLRLLIFVFANDIYSI
jgi:hypothetical protein